MMHVTTDSPHRWRGNKHIKTTSAVTRHGSGKYYKKSFIKDSYRARVSLRNGGTLLKSQGVGAECAGNLNDDFNGIIFYRWVERASGLEMEKEKGHRFSISIVPFKTQKKGIRNL